MHIRSKKFFFDVFVTPSTANVSPLYSHVLPTPLSWSESELSNEKLNLGSRSLKEALGPDAIFRPACTHALLPVSS